MIVIGGTELVNCDLFHICFAQVEGDEKEELLTGTSYLVSTKNLIVDEETSLRIWMIKFHIWHALGELTMP